MQILLPDGTEFSVPARPASRRLVLRSLTVRDEFRVSVFSGRYLTKCSGSKNPRASERYGSVLRGPVAILDEGETLRDIFPALAFEAEFNARLSFPDSTPLPSNGISDAEANRLLERIPLPVRSGR